MEKLKAEICDLYFEREELEQKIRTINSTINQKKMELWKLENKNAPSGDDDRGPTDTE